MFCNGLSMTKQVRHVYRQTTFARLPLLFAVILLCEGFSHENNMFQYRTCFFGLCEFVASGVVRECALVPMCLAAILYMHDAVLRFLLDRLQIMSRRKWVRGSLQARIAKGSFWTLAFWGDVISGRFVHRQNKQLHIAMPQSNLVFLYPSPAPTRYGFNSSNVVNNVVASWLASWDDGLCEVVLHWRLNFQ